jgi:ATP-binding cassette subfamily G (WHITE) protein 2 (SNQ2)
LVDHFSGVVRPGEMVLVLGQPGSGTTTTLRALAGYDEGYEKVEGVVRYGDVEMQEMKKKYR